MGLWQSERIVVWIGLPALIVLFLVSIVWVVYCLHKKKKKHDTVEDRTTYVYMGSAPVASELCGSSGSTSHCKSWKYDVFLSFRGEDARKTIISHLFSLLDERGVNVFIDTNGLEKGGDISSQLIDAIRSSRISVVIFSHDYAGSRWCLQELVEIMECKNKSQGQIVLPVFYDVVPSDVRNQRGDFGKAFAKHKHNKNVAQWRAALTEAGSLTGWDMTNSANGSEAEIVRKIARAISSKLNSTYLDVPTPAELEQALHN